VYSKPVWNVQICFTELFNKQHYIPDIYLTLQCTRRNKYNITNHTPHYHVLRLPQIHLSTWMAHVNTPDEVFNWMSLESPKKLCFGVGQVQTIIYYNRIIQLFSEIINKFEELCHLGYNAVYRRFGGTSRPQLQGQRLSQARNQRESSALLSQKLKLFIITTVRTSNPL
jgi:hypothetical protein